MRLRDFYDADAIALPLMARTRADALPALVDRLHLDGRARDSLLRILTRREELGSTGVGRGIAIPHGRSLVVNRVRLAYGYHPEGLPWDAVDHKPVHHFFLIVAPPIEVSNQYLPILGKIATFAKEPDIPERLSRISSAQEFFKLLEEKGV
jgi:PTS system nitrogen regulatory IIA component